MPNPSKNRVKLSDIARASGVSLTAVSLALNDKPGISEETRQRILEIAHSLGYQTKTVSFDERKRSAKTIGLFIKSTSEDNPEHNQFYSQIIAGTEAICHRFGIHLQKIHLPVNDDNIPIQLPALAEMGDLDGVLLAGILIESEFQQILSRLDRPVVLIDSYVVDGEEELSSVLTDNIWGAYEATAYLIEKGHRQIGFVGGNDHAYPSISERRSGYAEALRDFQITTPWYANCPLNAPEAIVQAVLELVRGPQNVTALVCANDDVAITTLSALNDAGIDVPQKVSVIGFDDIYLAEAVFPPLTTMRVSAYSMGKMAVNLLVNQINQVTYGKMTAVFCPAFVERESIRPLCGEESLTGGAD